MNTFYFFGGRGCGGIWLSHFLPSC